MKQMLFCALLVWAWACSGTNDTAQRPADEPTYTLIFMDKSLSVNANQAYANQKYQQAIGRIVDENIRTKGDKLEVYFIHENTSKARALTLTTRAEMDDVTNASPTDREAAQAAFELALQRERATLKRQVLTRLAQQNTGRSNQETDIWASLPVIARANETGMPVKVYYLSDMVESTKGPGRRDFHRTPPASPTQADEWAKADAKQLERYAIGSPDVTMILPFEPNASRQQNNPTVTQYWQTLLNELGAGNVVEE